MQSRSSYALWGLAVALLAAPAVPAADSRGGPEDGRTWQVDCGRGQTIRKALMRARHGDTISVSGTCVESVEIPEGVSGLTLDGNGVATIDVGDPTLDGVLIYGDDITVRGFTITGGRDGVNLRGALNVVVEHNTLEANARLGVNVHRVAFALIAGNTIRNNGLGGIYLTENASARIGFKETTDTEPTPNVIEGNAVHGIFVARSSNAFISGNVISRNARDGVHVEKLGQAEVTFNTLDENGQNGVFVSQNSGVHLGVPGAPAWTNRVNSTTIPNTGFGVQCSIGAYLVGSVGTLNGSVGAKSVETGCVDTTN
jgi:parallel beta-helix repeat protein